jgi:hypothetical protein
MLPGDEVIKRGTWLYGDSVPSAVGITQGETFFGSGDHEDSREVREDRNVPTFRVWFESPPGSGQFPACTGQFLTLDEAIEHASTLLSSSPSWE